MAVALDNLCDLAESNHASVLGRHGRTATISVAVPTASGKAAEPFHLILDEVEDGYVKVREIPPGRLPSFCIERHIDFGGAFCLYWSVLEDFDLSTSVGGMEWWRHLLGFLRNQQIADRQRRWAGSTHARAHGHEAAYHQALAEIAATLVGPTFAEFAKDGAMSIRRNGTVIRLMLDDMMIARLDPGQTFKVMDTRPDQSARLRRLLREIGQRPAPLARFIKETADREEAEASFWKEVKRLRLECCGTMDGCPLQSPRTG